MFRQTIWIRTCLKSRNLGMFKLVIFERSLTFCIIQTKQKRHPIGCLLKSSGNYLLSRAVTRQVSSAWRSLTTVFGMGTGVTSLLSSPNMFFKLIKKNFQIFLLLLLHFFAAPASLLHFSLSWGQALDLLVSVSFIRYRTSTSDLSTT